MNQTDLYELERLAGRVYARVRLLLSDCEDSDHRSIARPDEQVKKLNADLMELEKWIVERRA
jgi:hypothetical protein